MITLPKMLHDAIERSELKAIDASLSAGSLTQDELDQCLVVAMPKSSLDTIKLLLNHGTCLKEDAFHAAIHREEPAVFQLLIEAGWDINSTEFDLTAIHFALERHALLRWLLKNGASPDTMSQRRHGSHLQCRTPLALAATCSDPTGLQILLDHGAKMDPEAIFWAMGLHFLRTGPATMKVLIEHGADVNYVSETWCTPLYQTVRLNQKENLQLMLEHGADLALKSFKGVSALDLALRRARMDLYEMMKGTRNRGQP